MFRDRTEAGRRLADRIETEGIDADVVLGIPRGAMPVAGPVADRLGVPLDVVVASKIGAPHNSELAIGAAASDGSVWLNEDLLQRLDVTDTYLERERRQEAEAAREKERRYRGGRDPPDLRGKRVLIVDDGVATGATAKACIRLAKSRGAGEVLLAVPVGSPDAVEELRGDADRVLALETPRPFGAVGQYYERFDQVSDEEAMAYLDGTRSAAE